MLILSRRHGERIRLGEDVVITVLSSTKGRVRLGFEAPPGVTILREEVLIPPTRTEPVLEIAGEL
jgi:carbon storage regulator